jgi:hypothetical protein
MGILHYDSTVIKTSELNELIITLLLICNVVPLNRQVSLVYLF